MAQLRQSFYFVLLPNENQSANYSNHSFEIADKATCFEEYYHQNLSYNSPILALGTHFLFFVLDFFKVFIISCRTLQFKNINNLGRENVRKKGDTYEKNTILSLF